MPSNSKYFRGFHPRLLPRRLPVHRRQSTRGNEEFHQTRLTRSTAIDSTSNFPIFLSPAFISPSNVQCGASDYEHKSNAVNTISPLALPTPCTALQFIASRASNFCKNRGSSLKIDLPMQPGQDLLAILEDFWGVCSPFP